MRGVFVSGTGTGVGKTVVSAGLLAAFPAARYLKPVQTGSPPDDDAACVRALSGAGPLRVPRAGVRLEAPVSPHAAAEREGRSLTAADLARAAREAAGDAPAVVEGAGGLLVPLSRRELLIDLIGLLRLPVVLAVKVELGAINATLLSLEALDRRRLPVAALALVGGDDPSLASALSAFAPAVACVRLPRLEPLEPAALAAAVAPWRAAPGLAEALA